MSEARAPGGAGPRQLALNLLRREGLSFDNFLPGRNHDLLVRLHEYLDGAAPAGSFLLWGERGSGRTHLLTAAGRALEGRGRVVVYVPLADHARLDPLVLEDLEHAALVCLDDLEAIAGHRVWEAALFALYERLRARGGLWLAAARAGPAALGLTMPELATRLAAGWIHEVAAPGDADKLAALTQRAQARGLDLPQEVGRYVLTRFARDTHALFDLLDRIDATALAAQRRITIPLVRSLL